MSQKPTYEELEQRIRELEHAESELKRSNDEIMKFRAIADKAVHGNAIADLDGTIVYLNDFFARVHGYTPDDLIGKDLSVFHNEKQLVDVRRINENLIKNGSYNALEVWHTHKDGTEFPMLMNAVVIYGGNGAPMYLGATGIDITERKQTEVVLQESQSKLLRAQYIAKLGDFTWDISSGAVTWSEGMHRLLKYDLNEKIDYAEVNSAIHHPDDLQSVTKWLNDSIVSGKESISPKEYRVVCKDGEILEVHTEGRIEYKGGEAVKLFGTCQDITERKRGEEALRESHKRYQLIVENISNVVWTMDMNFHNTFVSPSVYQQRGYTPEEVKNQPLSERMNPNSIGKVLNLYNEKLKLIEAGDSEGWKPVEFEIEQPCKDGSTIWTTNTVRFLPGPDKQPASLLGTTHNITERKRAEEALRESEDKFRSFAEQSLVGIYLISGDVFKYVNPKFAEIFDYSVDECLDSMHFPQLVHPEDLAAVQKQVSRRLSGESKAVRYPFRGIKKSGETIHVEIYGSSMVLKGKTIATGTMLDITESKRAQEALRESEEKYRTILEDIEDGYFEIDIAGNLALFNGSLCEILGYSKDELTGMNNRQFTDEENAKKLYQTFNRVYTTGKSDKGFDWKIIRKDGNKRFVETSISLKKGSEGQPIGFQGIVRDVSDRRQIEKDKAKLEARLQRAQKMEAIGTLAGGVAHDLNNILGGLVSYPELLLLQLPEDSPLRKSILTIQKSGEKAAAVVQDLLTLARRGVVITEVVNLNHVVVEYLKSPEYENLQSYHPGIRIETDLEKDTLNILGSSTHLSKTVMNLVSNAAEAMSDGGNLTLSTEKRYIDKPIRSYDDVKEGDYVVLTISDTGTGISPDDINKIFEPFYTKKKMGRSGTGLGMAVVWGTVKDDNG